MDDDLVHEYDAAKRRAYYLKTRQLKGKRSATIKVTKPRPKAAPKPPVKTKAQRQAERRKQLEAQVTTLKNRLEALREVMAEKVKQAKARSGVKPAKSSSKKTASTTTSQTKSASKVAPKLTAKQKADAAKRSKEYYDENKYTSKDQLLANEVKSLTAKIKTIQERIAKMNKTGSTGARKIQSK